MKTCRVCGKRVNKVYTAKHLRGACRPCVENIYARLGIDIVYDEVENMFYEDTPQPNNWWLWTQKLASETE
jgi:hypothetical protein